MKTSWIYIYIHIHTANNDILCGNFVQISFSTLKSSGYHHIPYIYFENLILNTYEYLGAIVSEFFLIFSYMLWSYKHQTSQTTQGRITQGRIKILPNPKLQKIVYIDQYLTILKNVHNKPLSFNSTLIQIRHYNILRFQILYENQFSPLITWSLPYLNGLLLWLRPLASPRDCDLDLVGEL